MGRNNLQPVTVRIGDEVDTHGRVFVADTAHFFVKLVSGFKILGGEGKVEFAFTQIIGLRVIIQPSQFQFEVAILVGQIDDDESVTVDPPYLL